MAGTKRGWVKTENGWEPQDPRTKSILFQIDAGRPFKDIAAQFGVTLSAISHVRARAERERRIVCTGEEAKFQKTSPAHLLAASLPFSTRQR